MAATVFLAACGTDNKNGANPSKTRGDNKAPLPPTLTAQTSPPPTPSVPVTKTFTFNDGHLPDGWKKYGDGVPSTNGYGSYLESNVRVSAQGALQIYAEIDPTRRVPAGVVGLGHHFTGAVTSQDFLHGTTTVRARLPYATGPDAQIAKPVLMLWAQDDNAEPKAVEVDFLEAPYGRNRIEQNVNSGPSWQDKNTQTRSIPLDSEWHDYTVVWAPDELSILVDGKLQYATHDRSKIPTGPHHFVFQVDVASIPKTASEAGHREQLMLEIQSASITPLTRSLAPSGGPSLTH